MTKPKEILRSGRPPIFPRAIEHCNPVNASPYVVSYDEFKQIYATSEKRHALLHALANSLSNTESLGAKAEAILVGGSFLNLDKENPRDLDAVVFFSSVEGNSPAVGLMDLSKRSKHAGIDIRFVPADANVTVVVRAASFFTSLYTSVRVQSEMRQGVVLVDLMSGY